MRIAPVSFKSFTVQNLNNQQKNISSNVSFNAKRSPIDRFVNAFKPLAKIHEEVQNQDVIKRINEEELEKSGFKIYNKVNLDIKGKKVMGATFIKNSPEQTKIRVTDDKFYTLGEITSTEMGNFVNVKFNFDSVRGGNSENIGKAAYDSLFKYLKTNKPKIQDAHVFLHSDSKDFDAVHKFYLKYGFKELSSEGQPIRLLNYSLK